MRVIEARSFEIFGCGEREKEFLDFSIVVVVFHASEQAISERERDMKEMKDLDFKSYDVMRLDG